MFLIASLPTSVCGSRGSHIIDEHAYSPKVIERNLAFLALVVLPFEYVCVKVRNEHGIVCHAKASAAYGKGDDSIQVSKTSFPRVQSTS